MGDVKRYEMHIASQYPISGGCYVDKRVEENGDWMKYSDYATLLTRHNALAEAVKKERTAYDLWQRNRIMGAYYDGWVAARSEVENLLEQHNA